MTELSDLALRHQADVGGVADRTARRLLTLWNTIPPGALDAGWDRVAPQMGAIVAAGQVRAAARSDAYVNKAARAQDFRPIRSRLNPEALGGVTREGREVIPEMFAAITATKSLIGKGIDAGSAMRAGAGYLSVLGGTFVHDAGRAGDRTAAVGKGLTYSVRVIQPGACSRCAILAGVIGYRTTFERHPRCRCTSMPLRGDETPDGFFRTADEYFESLTPAEQDRVFTKAGAESIRLGADPAKVVNARRGMYRSSLKRPDGTYAPARLRPLTIGRKADGSPLQVFATTEGTTSRGMFGRGQSDLTKTGLDRYRRTRTLRLMPEQIMRQASSPARARELLERYGYLN